MFAIETFERWTEHARGKLASFTRAVGPINAADDPLAPDDANAARAVAALEAVFLAMAPGGQADDEAAASFRQALDLLTGGELEEEQAEDLVDGLADALEDEGFDIRLESVAEPLREDRALAEQTFQLCAAALRAAQSDPEEVDVLLADLADHLRIDDEQAERLRSRVDAVLG